MACLSTLRNGSLRSGSIRKISRRGRCTCRNPLRILFDLGSRALRMETQDRVPNPQRLGPVVLRETPYRPSPLLYPPPSHLHSPPSLPPILGYIPLPLGFTPLDILPSSASYPPRFGFSRGYIIHRIILVRSYSCCLHYQYAYKLLPTIHPDIDVCLTAVSELESLRVLELFGGSFSSNRGYRGK